MYYEFNVEVLQLIDGSHYHTIAKEASSQEEAMLEIIRDAIARGLSIEIIEFRGQYWEKPSWIITTFRKPIK